jgi:hypothetical protein
VTIAGYFGAVTACDYFGLSVRRVDRSECHRRIPNVSRSGAAPESAGVIRLLRSAQTRLDDGLRASPARDRKHHERNDHDGEYNPRPER